MSKYITQTGGFASQDGGFAFPQPATPAGNPIGHEFYSAGGMTLRDYFAAAALTGIIAARHSFDIDSRVDPTGKWAYQAADAMLAARDKPADDDFVNDDLLAACEDFRDSVLHGRHHLESVLDNDQTNAVLGLYDDTIGAAVAKAREASNG